MLQINKVTGFSLLAVSGDLNNADFSGAYGLESVIDTRITVSARKVIIDVRAVKEFQTKGWIGLGSIRKRLEEKEGGLALVVNPGTIDGFCHQRPMYGSVGWLIDAQIPVFLSEGEALMWLHNHIP